MIVAILGRQPAIGIAELERVYSEVFWCGKEAAIVETDVFDITKLGGTQKAGRVVAKINPTSWHNVSKKIVQAYSDAWRQAEGKITLGISAYGFYDEISARDVQKTGILLKQKLKKSNVNLRLIPQNQTALSTATSFHNKLGYSDKKIELIVVKNNQGRIFVAESIGVQNINNYAARDQGRPKRDAFVGMLPPKLAQIIINLSTSQKKSGTLLDPFCGTGVVLQEAGLMGFDVYGTDLSDKMIDFTNVNLDWLKEKYNLKFKTKTHQGDAMDVEWLEKIDFVACESYLGQPFSAPPSPTKLREVQKTCSFILKNFFKNISNQIESGTNLCVAIPAWKSSTGEFSHLSLDEALRDAKLSRIELKNVQNNQLLYYREDQVVARELLILEKD